MKKIVSLIVLVVFVASCSNDDSDEMFYNEIRKIEKKSQSQQLAKDEVSDEDVKDTVAPPPPPPINSGGTYELCEGCPIDPPKGGGKP